MVQPVPDPLLRFSQHDWARLHRLAFRLLGHHSEAEDAVQEACRRFLERPAAPPNPLAWLTQVVRNAAIDSLRRRWLRSGPDDDSSPDAPDTQPQPDQAAALAELADFFETELAALDPLDRRVIERIAYDGATVREIASAEGLSKSSVCRRIQDIRTQLCRAFERRFGESPLAPAPSPRAQWAAWLLGFESQLGPGAQAHAASLDPGAWSALERLFRLHEHPTVGLATLLAKVSAALGFLFQSAPSPAPTAATAAAAVAAWLAWSGTPPLADLIPEHRTFALSTPTPLSSHSEPAQPTSHDLNPASTSASGVSPVETSPSPQSRPAHASPASATAAHNTSSPPQLRRAPAPSSFIAIDPTIPIGPQPAPFPEDAISDETEASPRAPRPSRPPLRATRRPPVASRQSALTAPHRIVLETGPRRTFAGQPIQLRAVLHASSHRQPVTHRARWSVQSPDGSWTAGRPHVLTEPGFHMVRASFGRSTARVRFHVAPLPASTQLDRRTPLILNGRRTRQLAWRDPSGRSRALRLPASSDPLIAAADLNADGMRDVLFAQPHAMRWAPLGGGPISSMPQSPLARRRILTAAQLAPGASPVRLAATKRRWSLEQFSGAPVATLQGLLRSGRDRPIGLVKFPNHTSWHLAVRRGRTVRILELLPLRNGTPPVAIGFQERAFRPRHGRPVAAGDFDGDGRIDLALRRGSRLHLWLEGQRRASRWNVRKWRVTGSS